MRIPNRHLEHTVVVQALSPVPTSVGDQFLPKVRRSAIVVDSRKRVVDERLASETKGQEIQAGTHVLLQPEHHVPPGSLVTIWPGEPGLEATLQVAATAYARHSRAPSSFQAWLV